MTKTETTITEYVEKIQKKYGCCKVCAGMYELGKYDEKTEKKSSVDVHSMKLHDWFKLAEIGIYVLRVPGGWRYSDGYGATFIPFSKEFSGPVKYSKFEELTQKENTGVHKCPKCFATFTEDKMCLVTIPPDSNSFWVCETCFCIDGRRCMVKFGTTSSTQKTEKE